jgi:predicted flap endonuclease-1-like 5' DNA nuclease
MKKAYGLLALFGIWCLASALWYLFSVSGMDASNVNPEHSIIAIIQIVIMMLVSVLIGYGIAWYMRDDHLKLKQGDVQALLKERSNLLYELQSERARAKKAEHTLARARQTFHDDFVQVSRERDRLKEERSNFHTELGKLKDENTMLQIQLGNEKQKVNELTNNLQTQQLQASQKEKENSGVRYFINPFNIAASIEGSDIDDLKEIKGIGPLIEKKLNMLGIISFKQISELPSEALDQVAHALKFFPDRIRRDNWVQQARELSKIRVR